MEQVSFKASHIVKHYGGVVALSDGSIEINAGEVVALVGANGSGKSTLSKVITGVVSPDGGTQIYNGEVVSFPNPISARKAGVTAVYQELSLIPRMTVAENIWLAHEPLRAGGLVDKDTLEARTLELLALFEGTYHHRLNLDAPIQSLPPDEKQIVEILKAYSLNPKIMILDEATASLDSRQVARLFELVRQWKEDGMALVFVSHRMDEIFQIADRVVVLRNGATVGSAEIEHVSESDVVAMMVGEEGGAIEAERATPQQLEGAPEALCVVNLRTSVLRGVSFCVHKGELLGIGGLRGQGQRDLLLAIFGAIPFDGEIQLNGDEVHFNHPSQAMKKGIALVPGERATEGLLMVRSILENLHIVNWKSYGFPLKLGKARWDGNRMANSLNLVRESLDAEVRSLSGGNAQKVVIGKWLLRDPDLLLLDDPTKGVDVGTKTEFYRLLEDLREQGTTILFNSSDDTELLSLCDRILVLHDGIASAELMGDKITRANLVSASMGANGNQNSRGELESV